MDCTCMDLDAREALVRWQARAQPVLMRLAMHGHRIDAERMSRTLALVVLLERGDPSCTDPANAMHSHHAVGCPCAPRTHGAVCKLVKEPPAPVPQAVVDDWIRRYNAFMRLPTVSGR